METSRRSFLRQSTSLAALSALPFDAARQPLRQTARDAGIELCMSYFYGFQEQKLQLSRQMGVTGAITTSGPHLVGMRDRHAWELEPLAAIQDRFRQEGLEWKVVEGPPGLDKTKLGIAGRDEEIEHFITFLRHISQLGIYQVCYNWMPVISWARTSTDRKGRGGALVTAFDIEDSNNEGLTEYGEVSPERMWENLAYFIKAVVPEAEKYGVRLALHPDDPPVPAIRGISRIMTSVDAFKRLFEMDPSPSNGMCFCQGTFATMGEDIPAAIRYFGARDKIVFVHFRDVAGDRYHFSETFHDNGKTDMYEAMKAYYEVGFSGPMRPDHVPTMAGDSNDHPGYSILGNLFAIGYMKGLMEAVEKGS
jgi:mannonate dehydratase